MKKLLEFVILLLLTAAAAGEPRVVSLSPALTELVCELGGFDRLAGRSSACDRPEKVRSLPAAGDFASPSPEAVAALAPDIVISDTFQDPESVKLLVSWGIRVETLPLNSLDDYEKAVSRLGVMLNLGDGAARELARTRAERKRLAALAAAAPAAEHPTRVLILLWDAPPMSCGRKSFLNDLLALAGGVSITAGEDAGYYYPAVEKLIAADPEVIVAPETPGMTLDSVRGWTAVSAVANHRIRTVDPENSKLLFRLTPRWPEAAEFLKKLIAK